MSNKIIDFKLYRSKFCLHERLEYCKDEKRAVCRDCGMDLSLSAALEALARTESRYNSHVMELKKQVRKLEGRLRTKCRHCGKMTPI